MKNIFESILFSAFLIASAAFTFLPIDHYVVSSGYTIGFVSADPSGSFTSMSGDIYFDDADLAKIYVNNGHTYYEHIHGIIQHDVYHLGQIVILKKLL